MAYLTMAVIGAVGFGQHINLKENLDIKNASNATKLTFAQAFVEYIKYIFAILVGRKLFQWVPRRMGILGYLKFVEQQFTKHLQTTIKAKQEEIKNGSLNNNNDLLTLLVKSNLETQNNAKRALTDSELLSNSFIFYLAGHETTAKTLTWSLLLLASHPDVQIKCVEQIYKAIGKNKDDDQQFVADQNLEYQEFGKLNYLLAVMNEALRLFPVVPGIPKMSSQEVVIGKNKNSQGFLIPKDTEFHLAPDVLGRHPKYWKDCEKFIPERWLKNNEEVKNDYTYSFIPFSVGPRSCLGMKFAQVEIVLALAVILRTFDVSVSPKVNRETMWQTASGLTEYPKYPPLLVLKKRN